MWIRDRTKAEHVAEDLNGKIDMIIDGGTVDIGLESTICRLYTSLEIVGTGGDGSNSFNISTTYSLAVSYTHLDVYKRQELALLCMQMQTMYLS